MDVCGMYMCGMCYLWYTGGLCVAYMCVLFLCVT